jgi:hypothetical protein
MDFNADAHKASDTQRLRTPSSPRHMELLDDSGDGDLPVRQPAPQPISTRLSKAKRSDPENYAHPRPLPTPGRSAPAIPPNLLPSAPASPPTPAPSPGPHSRAPNWTCAGESEVGFLRESTRYFGRLDSAQRERYLGELLNMCNNQQLVFVHNFVAPKLKKDPFLHLPNELCLRVCDLALSNSMCMLTTVGPVFRGRPSDFG